MYKIIQVVVVGLCFSGLGCIRPFHEPLLVDINTSEVAVLVETVNDNGQAVIAPKDKENESESDFYENRVVNARKVEIPYYWKRTSRVWMWDSSTNGKWTPAARLIIIDTQPETREWSNTTKNPIWVESNDSVGFSTGISISARIQDRDAAIKFLSNYPPKDNRVTETQGGDPFTTEVTSLKQIMDQEVRTKIQEVFSYEAAAYNMDDLRSKKQEIMNKIKEVVIPYFVERGITITTIGQFGGFEYENPDIQIAINKVFTAQQDEEVAIAESKAAEQRKVAMKLTGEGEAAKILESRKGEAEGIKLVADAKAYELEKLNQNPEAYLALKELEVKKAEIEKWSGILPTMMFGESPMMMLDVKTTEK